MAAAFVCINNRFLSVLVYISAKTRKAFTPQLISCIQEGISPLTILQDCLVGIVVAVIALPLSMAFAIGSGLAPAVGLYTAIIAGFVVALLGGSRFQIAGPTGAFVVVVFDIVQRQGHEGLLIATLVSGLLLIIMGVLRLGVFLKYIPYPVVVGLTSGIAVILFTSQIKDFLGLTGITTSVSFWARWASYYEHIGSFNASTLIMGCSSLIIIVFLRKKFPKIPGAIFVIIAASFATVYFSLPVETVHSRFGVIPSTLPWPSLPMISVERLKDLMPDIITITVLAAIESLLSAVVADSMTGTKHRSDIELCAQGFGNIGSAFWGGLPVTGAIARTATNCRLGAKTPISAAVQAVVLFLILTYLGHFAGRMPLCTLSAVVIMTSLFMFEAPHFWALLKSSWSDALLLVVTFSLTVLIDITVAVEVGVLLAALLFTKKMADSVVVDIKMIGSKTEMLIQGPLFFAAAHKVDSELASHPECRKITLRLEEVPIIDASGIEALKKFSAHCKKRGQEVVLAGANPLVLKLLDNAGKIV